MALILLISTLTSCSSTMNLPGERLTASSTVYFIPLKKKPYMIYLSAQEPKEKSRSFSLADSVTATSTLLYPATIEKINREAFSIYKNILGDRLVLLPNEMRKSGRSFLGKRRGYRYNKFKAEFYIHLRFREKNRQARGAYNIRGIDFLQEALPVYPEGSSLLLDIFMKNRENRKFTKVYQKELPLFKKAPKETDSLESLNESFVWHLAYASGEKQLRFDFQKHITILRASVLERISSFLLLCGREMQKSMP